VAAVLLLLLLLQLLEGALDGLLLISSDLGEMALLLLLSAGQLRQSAVHLASNRATGRDTLSESLLRSRELRETRLVLLNVDASRAALATAGAASARRRRASSNQTSDRVPARLAATRGHSVAELAGCASANTSAARATAPWAQRLVAAGRLADHTSLTLDDRDADSDGHRHPNRDGNLTLLHDGLALLNLQKLLLIVSELLEEEFSGLLVLCLREVRVLLETAQLVEQLETPRVVLWLLCGAWRGALGLITRLVKIDLGGVASIASLEAFRVDGDIAAAEGTR
jgi:hypothetical protein